MITIAPSQRMNLADLFANHIGLRSALDAMLQGHYGEARADSAAEPKVAALAVGPFTFLGGDSAHPVADQLVKQFTDFRVISLANSDWHEKITMWQNSETSIEKRYAFSSERLDRAHLQLLATEGARGLVAQGFGGWGVERVVGYALEANKASCRVLEKAGLQRAREFRYSAERLPDFSPEDRLAVKYALDRRDFAKKLDTVIWLG